MIKLFKVKTPHNIGQKLEEVFTSGMITEGNYSDVFEHKLGNFLGNHNTALVNSGTSALSLSYYASGIKAGDEVITTPMTCMATNEPLEIMGAKIVWADIDPTTGNIDPASVAKKVTNRTKAIVGVHWAGQPFEIEEINNIASNHGLKVIEDAAHALGASYNGETIGNHSDYVCFSFQAIKHLTTGDGGAISCKTPEEYERLKRLRWFGLNRKYQGPKWEQDITESGFKYHMNNINAAIGIEQMKDIDHVISSHKKNGLFYDTYINNPKVKLLRRSNNIQSAHWIYSILVENRDSFMEYMTKNEVQTDIVHLRNDRYTVFKKFASDSLPGCDEFCSKLVNIPVGWWLSESDRQRITNLVNNWKG